MSCCLSITNTELMTAGSFHQKSTFFFTISKKLWADFWQSTNILISLKVFNQIFTFLWSLPQPAVALEVLTLNRDLVFFCCFCIELRAFSCNEFSLLTIFLSIAIDLWISDAHSFWSSGWPPCWKVNGKLRLLVDKFLCENDSVVV